ncbi:MAG: hypothetical protein ACJAVK_003094 [Akkermansiaceae bacterium]|jgi:hypothetical protein
MFLTSREMYAAEEAVFATDVPAEDLMNQAGGKIAREILRRFKTVPQNRAIAVIGRGQMVGTRRRPSPLFPQSVPRSGLAGPSRWSRGNRDKGRLERGSCLRDQST